MIRERVLNKSKRGANCEAAAAEEELDEDFFVLGILVSAERNPYTIISEFYAALPRTINRANPPTRAVY